MAPQLPAWNPQLAPAWSHRAWYNPAHGTPTPTDSMISEQLRIIETGISGVISTAEAYRTQTTLNLSNLGGRESTAGADYFKLVYRGSYEDV